jgi:hypothetical protein
MNDEFRNFALSKFSGCDFTGPDVDKGAIWLMGIEHGDPKSAGENDKADDSYSVEIQEAFPFNRKAFKLLAAMHGYGMEWRRFAQAHQPFVKGSPGWFKGNLYPYPCNSLDAWSPDAQAATGFSAKADYLAWCQEHRLPLVQSWVREYRPRVVLACGVQSKELFSRWLADGSGLQRREFSVPNERNRYFLHAMNTGTLIVVMPHLSSREWASDVSVHAAGCEIAALCKTSLNECFAG